MPDINYLRNVGALVAIVTSIAPESSGGGTINGTSIDRALHGLAGSCVLHQILGAESGAPTALAVQTVLQHSPDNVNWSNYQIGVALQQTAALTTANSENAASIDLTSAYRFIRAAMTVTLTGGTTPTALVAADLILGGERVLAAV